MQTLHSAPPAHLSDRELIARVHELAVVESNATAELVAHLAELDERKLYREEGYSSLFTYCVDALHLSEHAAYNRIEAARAAQRFPVVLEWLAKGSVHLTAVRLLRPHLTGENHRALLQAARHKRKREVEELVTRIQPKPDVAAVIGKLPERIAVVEQAITRPVEPRPATVVSCLTSPAVPVAPLPSAAPRAIVAPLAPERYRVQFTASAAAHDMLRQAQELLRHQIPDGDPAAIFEMALAVLVKELERRKFAASRRPFQQEPKSDAAPPRPTRHIPASVKREVSARDERRCRFIGTDGRRCSERGWLEFHHRRPFARGGPATAENIEIRCRSHNSCDAELQFRPRERRQALHLGSPEASSGPALVPERVKRAKRPVG